MQHTKDVEILRSSNDSLLREKEHAVQELSRLQERFTAADRRHSAAMKEHGAIRVRRSPHLARPALDLPAPGPIPHWTPAPRPCGSERRKLCGQGGNGSRACGLVLISVVVRNSPVDLS